VAKSVCKGEFMDKIRLGRTNMMVSRLGCGGIPIQRVSEDEAVVVIRRCLELGVTFLDTSHGYTNSEEKIGKAIAGWKEKPIISTRTGSRKSEEVESHLKLSLKRLGVDYIDLFAFHDVSSPDSLKAILAPDGPMAVVQAAKKAGIVKHIGVTSHSLDLSKEMVKSGHFETIMFPFNFILCEAVDELLPLTREHDVGFIVMKPMAGGMLDNAAIAFKYLLQFPDVLQLVGIERPEEMEEIVQVLEGPWSMSEAEQNEMERLRAELGARFCRRCGYCQPCPEGVPISMLMLVPSITKRMPAEIIFASPIINQGIEKAANCIQCGECEEKCPYDLPISELIEEHVAWFQEEKKKYQG
jgi:predicted aldo/keto reductase-like oxidoreductase